MGKKNPFFPLRFAGACEMKNEPLEMSEAIKVDFCGDVTGGTLRCEINRLQNGREIDFYARDVLGGIPER